MHSIEKIRGKRLLRDDLRSICVDVIKLYQDEFATAIAAWTWLSGKSLLRLCRGSSVQLSF